MDQLALSAHSTSSAVGRSRGFQNRRRRSKSSGLSQDSLFSDTCYENVESDPLSPTASPTCSINPQPLPRSHSQHCNSNWLCSESEQHETNSSCGMAHFAISRWALLSIICLLALSSLPCANGQAFQQFTVLENLPPQTKVGNIAAVFNVASSGVSVNGLYSLPVSLFRVTDNGDIFTERMLDRESEEYESTTIMLHQVFYNDPTTGQRTNGLVQTTIIIGDENDNSPTFNPNRFEVSVHENANPDTQVIDLPSATDKDDGVNSTQEYRIVSGNVGGAFRVRTIKGVDARALVYVNRTLDHETIPLYELVVRAYDGQDKTGDAVLVVSVTDLNDETPVFTTDRLVVNVREDVDVPTTVVTLTATDPEEGSFGDIVYELDSVRSTPTGEETSTFTVGRSSGAVITARALDRERVTSYELVIFARNPGETSYGTSTVVIEVDNVNDLPPRVSVEGLYAGGRVDEGLEVGKRVALVTLSDDDLPSSDTLTSFSVDLLNDYGFFEIKSDVLASTYGIVVSKELDREARSEFNLTIVAGDGGNPALYATAWTSLIVSDVNDNAPVFVGSPFTGEVQEKSGGGVYVTRVVATDADIGSNAAIEYNMVAHPVTSAAVEWFQINATSGVVTTRGGAGPIDCGRDSQPTFTVVARDKGTPSMESNTTIMINVIDRNDNRPDFGVSFYEEELPEDAPVDSTCFLRVLATDGDCGLNSVVTYSFDSSSGSRLPTEFSIGPTSGQICLVAPLDYEDGTRRKIEFPVLATDSGNLSTSVVVKVNVKDVNDNFPIFSSLTYAASVSQRTSVNDTIRVVTATDSDSEDFGRVRYRLAAATDAESQTLFAVDTDSGRVLLRQHPSDPSIAQYIVIVEAYDGGGLVSRVPTSLTVHVSTESNLPEFDLSLYEFSTDEGRHTTARFLGRVTATPPNAGAVTYSVVSGNDLGYFRLNAVSGEVTTVPGTLLDADLYPTILLHIQASTGAPPQLDSAQVRITLTDINDNAPQFPSYRVSLSVAEDAQPPHLLFTFHATDGDKGSNSLLSYHLGNTEAGDVPFNLNSTSGELFLAGVLDYENGRKEYSVRVTARDHGTPTPLSSSPLICLVTVTDVNDVPPSFDEESYTFYVNETAGDAWSSVIGTVTATDPDSSGTLVYRVSGSGDIDIQGSTGGLFSLVPLDRESTLSYSLIVNVSDGLRSAVVPITVILQDVNDNSPEFARASYEFSVLENQAAIVEVGTVGATDRDDGVNADITFSLDSVSFSINGGSGVISTMKSFDRENMSAYHLTVVATDNGAPTALSSSVPVMVRIGDINDNRPSFVNVNLGGIRVSENVTANSTITQVTATDSDLGDNSKIKYSVTRGSEWVWISHSSGWLYTSRVLDRERTPSIKVTVTASDRGSPSLSSEFNFTVQVTDKNEPPSFPTSYVHIAVPEDNPVTKSFYTVNATDRDLGGNAVITYSLAGNDSFFRVDADSGELYNLYSFDRESVASYELLVDAQDAGERAHTTRVNVSVDVVDVNDNTPIFESNPYVFNVKENTRKVLSVGRVQAHDNDPGKNGEVTYSILFNGKVKYFDVDRNSGMITTIADQPIDYEEQKILTFRVLAKDKGIGVTQKLSTTTVIIEVGDVNDNSPRFASRSEVFVREDELPGFPLLLVAATDEDVENSVMVTITGGNTEGNFQLNSTLGLLTLGRSLDHERNITYSLTITATDDGTPQRSTEQTVLVHVIDINDNPPHFTESQYRASIPENMIGGSSVVTVKATDPDSPPHTELTYLIPGQGNTTADFAIGQHGEITTVREFDREVKDQYVFAVYVQGNSYPRRFDMAEVIVTVTDVNDHAPMFLSKNNIRHVPENSESGVVRISVQAEDPDQGPGGTIVYNIIHGNEDNLFSVDSFGTIVCKALDREVKPRHILILNAEDEGTPRRSSNTTVTIIVDDTNDNDPVFAVPPGGYKVSVAEDVDVGYILLNVSATDWDAGNNSKIQYFFANEGGLATSYPNITGEDSTWPAVHGPGLTVNGSDGKFSINSSSGTIHVRQKLDREKVPRYIFDVVAVDSSEFAPRQQKARVEVEVTDVNDNAPEFTISYATNITRSAIPGSAVITVEAKDKDDRGGVNGQVTYSIINQADNPYFTIGSTSGAITVISTPTIGLHDITVQAEDHGTPQLHTTTQVLVNVGTQATLLFFDHHSYEVYLDENVGDDVGVLKVEAKHKVQNIPVSVTYSIKYGPATSTLPFNINSNTGEIRTWYAGGNFDYEVQSRYYLQVVGSTASGKNSAYCTVIVTLRDINDNAPQFDQERYSVKVPENNQLRRYVVQVKATDLDSNDNGEVTYSLVNPDVYPASQFKLYGKSGYLFAIKSLDRDLVGGDTIRLTVNARDNGKPNRRTATAVVKINVLDMNDVSPVFTSPDHVAVRESMDVAREVMVLSALDSDADPKLEFSFVEGGNPGDYFSLDTLSGRIGLKRKLDREKVSSVNLQVAVNDSVHYVESTVNVTVTDENDNNPIFQNTPYQASLNELSPAGQDVIQVFATDLDSGANGRVRYSLDGDKASLFTIDEESGMVKVAQKFEYDPTEPTFQVMVRVVDSGSPPASNMSLIRIEVKDINNFRPTFSRSLISQDVSENMALGMTVVTVSAQDNDKSPENRHIVYSIVDGDPSDVFEMIQTVGQQYLGEIKLKRRLDREKKDKYTLTIRAQDLGTQPKSSTTKVEIIVTDVNDNAPEFEREVYEVTVPENTYNRSVTLVEVNAFDNDTGPNGRITYMIHSGDSESKFGINQTSPAALSASSSSHTVIRTGSIFLNAPLDFERESSYELSVFATDGGGQARDSYTTVRIQVVDVNEYVPRFDTFHFAGTIPEGLSDERTLITQAKAKDLDGGPFGVIRYSLEGDEAVDFKIDSTSGWVSPRAQVEFDAEVKETYKFKVLATDSGEFSQWVEMTVTIEDLDEFAPVFSTPPSGIYSFSVPYAAKVGTPIGTVFAQDLDKRAAGVVIYRLYEAIADMSGRVPESYYFGIEESTGKISVRNLLYEAVVSSNQIIDSTTIGKKRRRKRAVSPDTLLIVEASSGLPGSLTETVSVNVTVSDFVAPPVTDNQTQAPAGDMTMWILVAVFGGIFVIAILIVAVVCTRRHQRKNAKGSPLATRSGSDDVDFAPVAVDTGPPLYDPRQPSPTVRAPTAASSGRGSAEFNTDMEIEHINSGQHRLKDGTDQGLIGQPGAPHREPDSGWHDATTPELTAARNCKEFLAGLGIDAAKMDPIASSDGLHQSVESMHQFSEEGGGEDPLDMSMYRAGHRGGEDGGGEGMASAVGMVGSKGSSSALLGSSITASSSASPSQGGSLSNLTDATEELSGSYNWDYLLDWGPRYTTLAHVFTEIARLKDDSVQPRTQPVRTVPQHHLPPHLQHGTGSLRGTGDSGLARTGSNSSRFKPPSSKMEPPPIITSAPPRTMPANGMHQQPVGYGAPGGHYTSGHHQPPPQHQSMNSARTSQLTSMTSLARSPISHESSFSNLAFTSGGYTPAWTPMARSPSISTLQSGQTTPPLESMTSSQHRHMMQQPQHQPQQYHHPGIVTRTNLVGGGMQAETEFPIL